MAVHALGLSYHAARPVAALDRFAISHDLHLRLAGVLKTKVQNAPRIIYPFGRI